MIPYTALLNLDLSKGSASRSEAAGGPCVDRRMRFKSYRVCDYGGRAYCRGFWDHHRNDFASAETGQRLQLAQFVP
jgi:hypothetical protein